VVGWVAGIESFVGSERAGVAWSFEFAVVANWMKMLLWNLLRLLGA